ncbi:hypothetical protein KMW28_19940 [Flammeovirga yaeyamensis]|uniref:Sortilin N-terminal domain-containing protein n=1 Tax=Flammeovirga yaeyamensis TaxID=367791 RepID=A0AAX1N320_9BACT|nr:hypothetical protein [Flammeovirga yaeyamensis]MBB3701064.1 photosystem II stability/assembly factor-like uncharacterized protein [Flammeovirga yaeyamensis]NMF38105.1 hypothetical protein [Flammeovirga yaeyamensis]QWG01876.1 hypothetical protein KMW28_19940 [Flammeovirga yaeyamensis]
MKKLIAFFTIIFIFGAVVLLQKIETKEDTSTSLPEEFTGDDVARIEYAKKRQKRLNGYAKADKPDKFLSILRDMKTRKGESSPSYLMGYKSKELTKSLKVGGFSNARTANTVQWIERGPGNVPGRTRAFALDPDDADMNTWFAGSVGGGIWKTTDRGQSWTNLTPDLPNIAISSLVIAPSNHDVMYATTGEGFGGSAGFIKGDGVLKSVDGGTTWTQLTSTVANEDFQNTNRIIVDPNNENNIVVCTSNDPLWASAFTSGIFKSTDGGTSWTKTMEATEYVQQVIADPNDFNIQYAAVRSRGVFKSTDAGATWTNSSSGLSAGGRIELAISPKNTDYIYASIAGSGVNSTDGNLYYSEDAGATWIASKTTGSVNFLGGQGWYDNTIAAHPFDEKVVYAAGVNIFKIELSDTKQVSSNFIGASATGDVFYSFINFSGDLAGGIISQGETPNTDMVSVEVRFGPGLTQKAHRYTVGGAGAGVPSSDYVYEDYVDVPFEVWDVTNNRQLMVGFRDQQEDGKFNLANATDADVPSADQSREYLYINNIDYSETASSEMAQDGGMENDNMYFLWPVLDDGSSWDESNLPSSTIVLEWGNVTSVSADIRTVTDAYGQYDGNNSFAQTQNSTTVEGVHPDHHNIMAVVTGSNEFMFIDCNDGGIYYSDKGTNPGIADDSWYFAGNGYNTTQFYDVDKAPGESRYIGGSQDNGTWMSQVGEEGSADAKYKRSLGGDGFATIWNHDNPDLILGTIYNNAIYKSVNGGSSFSSSNSGITDTDDGGPFITKLSNTKTDPDVVYAVGGSGVWKSTNFGDSWSLSRISEAWAFGSFIDVKVSDADRDVVWAGAALTNNFRIHVSKDQAKTFTAVENFLHDGREMGQISGLATHPNKPNVAYILFSYANAPKIIKTEDYGQSWEDISGFGNGTSSTTGFPDVAVYDLMVFPQDENKIWVGTEVGIFETTDNAVSWHRLSGSIPATSIWDMKIVDDQVVVGTHGRGIWTATIAEIPAIVKYPSITQISSTLTGDVTVDVHLKSDVDSLVVYDDLGSRIVAINEAYDKGDHQLMFLGSLFSNIDKIKVYAYTNEVERKSYAAVLDLVEFGDVIDEYVSSNPEENVVDDFNGDLFKEFSVNNPLKTPAFHSQHPYAAGLTEISYLNNIIKVAEEDAHLIYSDIAFIANGSKVSVQGSKDGANWIDIVAPYDASYNSDWNSYVNFNSDPLDNMFVQHEVNLLDYFEAGDNIAVRFVLEASNNIPAWGWAISQINIQGEVSDITSIEDYTNASSIKIGPTVISNGSSNLFIDLKQNAEVELKIIDLNGSLIQEKSFGNVKAGQNKLPFDFNANKGIYVGIVSINNYQKSIKLLVK